MAYKLGFILELDLDHLNLGFTQMPDGDKYEVGGFIFDYLDIITGNKLADQIKVVNSVISGTSAIYNVTACHPLSSGYYLPQSARLAVPSAYRKVGLRITNQVSDTK